MTTFPTFGRLIRLAALFAAGSSLLAIADGAGARDAAVTEVPAVLNPDKLSILRVVSATGVQVYSCSRNPSGVTSWILKGPDAQLFDPQDKLVGKHYAGPTWEGLDGGKVVGELKTSIPAPADKSVPWLLLNAKSHEGSGTFTEAQAIVRMETSGGAAPGDGCEEARAGQELRVPYTAVYVFLK
jgi:hypothetical protein